MRSRVTRGFRELYDDLPVPAKKAALQAYQRFKTDPRHPGLHFKHVHARQKIVSARINDDYRVLGILEGDTVDWFWIGPHADYDKLLRRS